MAADYTAGHEGGHNTRMATGIIDLTMTVADLMTASGEWDGEKLRSLFTLQEVEAILSIPVIRSEALDTYIWRYNKYGKYSVKSGYWAVLILPGMRVILPSFQLLAKEFFLLVIPFNFFVIFSSLLLYAIWMFLLYIGQWLPNIVV